MDFQSAPDSTYLTHRMTSGRVEIGVYRVIFGYRVRAGFIGHGACMIDYCCGDKSEWVNRVYGAVLTVLSARDEHEAFLGFPMQTVKPMRDDYECFVNLCKMMKGQRPIKMNIDVPEIDQGSMFNIEEMFK